MREPGAWKPLFDALKGSGHVGDGGPTLGLWIPRWEGTPLAQPSLFFYGRVQVSEIGFSGWPV